MKKEEFISLIKKAEIALAFDDVEVIHYEEDEIEVDYQIDDRIEDRTDKSVVTAILKVLGDDWDAGIDRRDAFPNGYATYKLSIYKTN